MKLCTDCRWFSHDWRGDWEGYCVRPLSDRRSTVTGSLDHWLLVNASRERRPGRTWFGLGRERCGPDARFFEAKGGKS